MSSDLFGIPPSNMPLWKTNKYYICQTPGMSLWVAIQIMSWTGGMRGATRDEYKYAVRSFEYPVNSCKCKDCRYFRLTNNNK